MIDTHTCTVKKNVASTNLLLLELVEAKDVEPLLPFGGGEPLLTTF